MEANCCLTLVPLPAVDTVPVVVVGPPEIDQLETTAQELNCSISHGQKSLAADYWKLGDTLLALRPLYPHGTWENHLSRLGIDHTRSKRAVWFRNNYTTLAKAEKVESPTKAYAERDRKQIQSKKKVAAKPATQTPPQALKIAGNFEPVSNNSHAVAAESSAETPTITSSLNRQGKHRKEADQQPPKENPDSPLALLVKVGTRLAYLHDEIKEFDWAKVSAKEYRNALASIIKTAHQLGKEIPNGR